MKITKLDLPKCKVGEGPVWDVAEQALYYVDIVAMAVVRWDPASGDFKRWQLPDIVGSMPLREGAREAAPGDGCCFVIDGLGVQGLPEPRYAG